MSLRDLAKSLATTPTTETIRRCLTTLDRTTRRNHSVRDTTRAMLRSARLPHDWFIYCCECGLPVRHHDTVIDIYHARHGTSRTCETCADALYGDNGHIHDGDDYMPEGLRGHSTDVLSVYTPKHAPLDGPAPKSANFLYMGVELEAECKGDYPHSIALDIESAMHGFAICKSDGSLRDGVEIVTVPATLAAHKAGPWPALMKGPGQHLAGWSTTTAGMHIHINRRALTFLHLARLVKFINDSNNRPLVTRVAGRNNNQFCTYTSGVTLTSLLRGQPDGKYRAINISPSNTVEIRIFRSNVSLHGVYRNIEFVHSLVTFLRDASNADCTQSKYLEWLSKNPSGYENIIQYLGNTHGHTPLLAVPKHIVKRAIEVENR